MKKKDLKELKTKNKKDLRNLLLDTQKKKTEANLELKMARVKNVHAAGFLRRDIARLKTILRLKNLVEENLEQKGKENVAS